MIEMLCEGPAGCLDPFTCACLGGCRYPWFKAGLMTPSGGTAADGAINAALDGILMDPNAGNDRS